MGTTVNVTATNAETQSAISESYAGRVQKFDSVAAMLAEADDQSNSPAQPMPMQVNVRISDYPQLRAIAWNRRADDEIAEPDALAMYEREWRHVDQDRMTPDERRFLQRLIDEHGRGVFVPA